jgi:uncharacterized phiE125 gp8 family phage protein
VSDVYLLGDTVRLSTTVTDAAGAPADPTSLTLTYTDTAGTAVVKHWPSPAEITRDSVGVFRFDVTGLTAGHYRYTWTASGLYAGTDTDVIDVYDPDAVPRLVSTADAKAFLRLSGSADDALLERMLTWASARIVREVGAVVASTWTETVHAVGGFVLSKTPVISLTTITPLTTSTPMVDVASLVVTNALAGAVGTTGTVSLNGYYTVTYRAGYTTVPPGVDGAALDLVRHWWNQTQSHGSATYGDDGFVPDFTTLPNSVLNKLASIPRISGLA